MIRALTLIACSAFGAAVISQQAPVGWGLALAILWAVWIGLAWDAVWPKGERRPR